MNWLCVKEIFGIFPISEIIQCSMLLENAKMAFTFVMCFTAELTHFHTHLLFDSACHSSFFSYSMALSKFYNFPHITKEIAIHTIEAGICLSVSAAASPKNVSWKRTNEKMSATCPNKLVFSFRNSSKSEVLYMQGESRHFPTWIEWVIWIAPYLMFGRYHHQIINQNQKTETETETDFFLLTHFFLDWNLFR